MVSRLPQRPNLEAIKKSARETQNHRTLILSLIGNISFCWSNNESMFIYIIMILLRTDETSAKIIFGTLNTTRARVDLVQRLIIAHVRDEAVAAELRRIIRIFNECTKIRNEFIHCLFHLDGGGDITHTHSLRIQIEKGELYTGITKPIDEERIKKIVQVIKKLIKLNDDIWVLLPVLERHMEASAQSSPRKPSSSVQSETCDDNSGDNDDYDDNGVLDEA